ncbi:hypothetical protein TNCV_2685871 [Trichonephila clavipes]|nr:hypothetical protein TNCV_2685871 [Trichonephila clavipes]
MVQQVPALIVVYNNKCLEGHQCVFFTLSRSCSTIHHSQAEMSVIPCWRKVLPFAARYPTSLSFFVQQLPYSHHCSCTKLHSSFADKEKEKNEPSMEHGGLVFIFFQTLLLTHMDFLAVLKAE